jgi:hypothetical protein
MENILQTIVLDRSWEGKAAGVRYEADVNL